MTIVAVGITPKPGNLPGFAAFQNFADGLQGWALLAAALALVIGAAIWALGSHSQNMHQSMAGRRAVSASIVAALLIGAAPNLVNWFYNIGHGI